MPAINIKNAIISVSDKTGVVELAQGLNKEGINLYSTGNTFKKIKEAGIAVSYIEALTGMEEILGGRVRTLHPGVHAGILHRRDVEVDRTTMAEKNFLSIDLVVTNLYPFEQVVKQVVKNLAGQAGNKELPEQDIAEAVENIDIGGVTLLRAAAKNYRWVTVVTDQADYSVVLDEIKKQGNTSESTRERLAANAFLHTRNYDTHISQFLSKHLLQEETDTIHLKHKTTLRYGENPHQSSTLFENQNQSGCKNDYRLNDYRLNDYRLNLARAQVLHGKEMSHNNYLDSQAAISTCWDFPGNTATAVVVKHQNPCGIATGSTIDQALTMAWEGDIVSAFGSVIAFNQEVNLSTAEFISQKFVEIIIAPGFHSDALEVLKKEKNLRIVKIDPPGEQKSTSFEYRQINGGWLRQEFDTTVFDSEKVRIVSSSDQSRISENNEGGKLSTDDLLPYQFAYTCVKHIKSNAITLTHQYAPGQFMLMGMGAGQPNRIDATRKLALTKAEENITRLHSPEQHQAIKSQLILASDAFFPFKDNIDMAHQFGITRIIQPGGSIKDGEVIAQAQEYGIEMVFTNIRHFLH